MKNGRWLVVGALVICMASCGIFFAPLEGRWNPLDPDFGAGFTKDIAYPSVDGYVDYSMSYFHGDPVMRTDYMSLRALLKFNTKDIPADLEHAELELYLNTVVAPAYGFRVRLILGDWDPDTVNYSYISTTAGFIAPLASPAVPLSEIGFYSWDVTALLHSVAPASVQGFLVEPAEGMGIAQFLTTENATSQPHLVIWTR